MVTIKDVALKAGVSVTTVSRVMNNRGPLSENTKKAVRDAMDELGYLPNDVARALGKNSLNVIGLVVPSINHPFFGEMVHEFEYYSYKSGYKLMVFASGYDYEKEKRCVSLLRRSMVDCIVYASHTMGTDFLEDMHVPAVTLDNTFEGLPAVLSDNAAGGFLAARHLIARKCRRIVHISGRLDLKLSADERTRTFAEECERQKVSCRIYPASEKMLFRLDYTELINRVFRENPDLDGIFASSDIIGAQCLQMALSMGYRVPEDIKIVGYDDTCVSRLVYPPMTTIRQNIHQLVKTAMDTVIAAIEEKEIPAVQTVPVSLVERRTT